jgi:sulfur relay (sulfurtransferase) complex TusBCD TusD component (DsrE family)
MTGENPRKKNSLLVQLAFAPYGHEEVFAAVCFSNACLAKGMEVGIMLYGDAVYSVKAGQNPAVIGLPDNTPHFTDFMDLGGELFVCEFCATQRAMVSGDFIEGTQLAPPEMAGGLLEKYDVTLTF